MVKNRTQRTHDELMVELNRLLAEEVEAALRYLHLTLVLEPADSAVAPLFRQAFTETVEHAWELGQKIRSLGGMPQLDVRLHCPGEAVGPAEAVADVLTFEEAALEGYQELAERVEGSQSDADLVGFARKQVELETEHVEMFRKLKK